MDKTQTIKSEAEELLKKMIEKFELEVEEGGTKGSFVDVDADII